MPGMIFDLKRFAVHDGPGIRMTVFLKGCPLRCPWCHNPEGVSASPELSCLEHRCIGCGECAAVCPNRAHFFQDGIHKFDRSRCTACGKCAEVCLGGALRLYGRIESAETLMPKLLEDREFYERSGGGVTLSGGEPLLQPEFAAELLARLRAENIHTAVDTSGNVPWKSFERVLPYTEMFLYDFKHPDDAAHRQVIGVSNRRILDNLERLSGTGKRIEIRIPVIPGFNDAPEVVRKTADFLASLPNPVAVRLLPYHDLARGKFLALGKCDTMPHVTPPDAETMERISDRFLAAGIACIDRTSK